MSVPDLPIIQKTYDLILWYVPRLNKFPRDTKFVLGDRIQATLYGFLEGLIRARYRREKVVLLGQLSEHIEILRMLVRLSCTTGCLAGNQQEYAARQIDEIGRQIGGWMKFVKEKTR